VVSKIKVGEDSAQSLLGPPALAALLSIPVAVAATVPDDVLLVVDRRAILSACGPGQARPLLGQRWVSEVGVKPGCPIEGLLSG